MFSSFSDLFYGWSIERKQHTCYVALTRTLDASTSELNYESSDNGDVGYKLYIGRS